VSPHFMAPLKGEEIHKPGSFEVEEKWHACHAIQGCRPASNVCKPSPDLGNSWLMLLSCPGFGWEDKIVQRLPFIGIQWVGYSGHSWDHPLSTSLRRSWGQTNNVPATWLWRIQPELCHWYQAAKLPWHCRHVRTEKYAALLQAAAILRREEDGTVEQLREKALLVDSCNRYCNH